MKALEYARFNIRDIDSQVFDSLGIRVHISNAKSHEERGKVERKIIILNLPWNPQCTLELRNVPWNGEKSKQPYMGHQSYNYNYEVL